MRHTILLYSGVVISLANLLIAPASTMGNSELVWDSLAKKNYSESQKIGIDKQDSAVYNHENNISFSIINGVNLIQDEPERFSNPNSVQHYVGQLADKYDGYLEHVNSNSDKNIYKEIKPYAEHNAKELHSLKNEPNKFDISKSEIEHYKIGTSISNPKSSQGLFSKLLLFWKE